MLVDDVIKEHIVLTTIHIFYSLSPPTSTRSSHYMLRSYEVSQPVKII
jgi:hypothetical protein